MKALTLLIYGCLMALVLAAGMPALAQQESEELFKQNDHNGDGMLSREEFPEQVRNLFDRIDVNKDGVVTLEEDKSFRRKQAQRQRPPLPPPDYANIQYGPDERNVFDLWLTKSDKPTPLVIYYHGGGFRGGDKRSISRALLTKLLANGISVAAVNYRLSGTAPFPAQMHDCARSLQFIRFHAEDYNLDPSRIGATGGSAGAGISEWLAFHDSLADPSSDDLIALQSTRLTCIVVYAAQTSYDPRFIKKLFDTDQVHSALILLFGMESAEDVDDPEFHPLFEEASPINHLTADDPPVMLFYPQLNQPLPPNSTGKQHIHHPKFGILLKEKMDELGIECVLKFREDYPNDADGSVRVDDYLGFFLKHLRTELVSTGLYVDLPWKMTEEMRAEIQSWRGRALSDHRSRRDISAPDEAQRAELKKRLAELDAILQELPEDSHGLPSADVAVWAHAAALPLANDEWRTSMHYSYMLLCAEWGIVLAQEYQKNPDLFSELRGQFVLGHRSEVDRSAQPYVVRLPSNFQPDRAKPYRLVIDLHGRSFWNSEPSWVVAGMLQAVHGDEPAGDSRWDDDDIIDVRPFGRFISGYRGAGETDVWEVIQDVQRRYPIDPDKITLTGFSMGGGGTMRLGMLNPGPFAAVAPLAMAIFGSAPVEDDIDYSSAFAPLTGEEVAQRLAAIYNVGAIVVNGKGLPILMGVGTKDGLSRYHRDFETFFDGVGVPFVSYYIGGVGHNLGQLYTDQHTRFLRKHVRDPDPEEIWFATTHLRHAKRAWIQVEGLKQHYKQAEVHARANPSDGTLTVETRGITRLSLRPTTALLSSDLLGSINLDGQYFEAALSAEKATTLALEGDKWHIAHDDPGLRKRPGLTGPVSDAFSAPFLCVRPTGKAWNTHMAQWSDRQLEALKDRWAKTYRGFLPVKDDVDVTLQDRQQYHLVLFGDPGSNSVMAEFLDRLNQTRHGSGKPPLMRWSKDDLILGTHRFSAQEHAPVLIYPNPDIPDRYIVLNARLPQSPMSRRRSGAPTEPPLVVGDFAILSLPKEAEGTENIVFGGFFDEEWELMQE